MDFWDHLIQDYDSSKANYGVVSEHPELLDVNFIDSAGSASGGRDWLHCNGIDYNQELDQIAISCKNTNEIYIIDHSTTTEEASGHTGGNSGMGGDILYRYGNQRVIKGEVQKTRFPLPNMIYNGYNLVILMKVS